MTQNQFEGISLFDIDNFHGINVTKGIPTGDAIICVIANALSESDWEVFRIGGEDFVVILENEFSLDQIDAARTEISFRIRHELGLKVTLSTGGIKKPSDMVFISESALRGSDFLSRWAGDEFAVVMDNTTLDKARVLAQRIHSAIEEKTASTISIGVYCGVPESSDSALKLADEALYEAKRKGKNLIEFAGSDGNTTGLS